MNRSKYAFRYLFGGLLSILVVLPLLRYVGFASGKFGSFLTLALFVVLVLAALPAVGITRTRLILAGSVAFVLLVLVMLLIFGGLTQLDVPFQLIMLGFLSYVVVVAFQYLFRKQRVTVDTIIAALCVYLLMGIVWSFAYSLVDTLAPGSFSCSVFEAGAPFMQIKDSSFYPLYYSFVTLTTLGYGDVVPVSRVASMLAVTEAMAGQIYLAVLVARLVGLQVVAHSRFAGPGADAE